MIVPSCPSNEREGGAMPLHAWLDIDLADAAERIPRKMREIVSATLLRRGCVVAVSGGIDSSVCAALATRAIGKEKGFALVLPDRDSSPASKELGVRLCEHLGVPYEVMDIASTLEAIGCYRWRDDAIRSVFPEYGDGWKNKIVISRNLLDHDRMNFFRIVIGIPQGEGAGKRRALSRAL